MNQEKMKELFEKEAFVKELLLQETAEDVQALFLEKGIDISVEDIMKVKSIVEKKIEEGKDGLELSEDDLMDVSGGYCALPVLLVAVIAFGGLAYMFDKRAKPRW